MTATRWLAYVLWLTFGAFLIACAGDTGPWVTTPIAAFFVLSGSMVSPQYFGWREAPRRSSRHTSTS